METEKVYAMPFAKIYPMLVEKAARKGRTQAEVDEIIGWLTGYSVPQIEAAVQNGTLYGDFFRDAPQLQSGPGAHKGQHLQRKAGEHRRTADEGDPLFGQAGG